MKNCSLSSLFTALILFVSCSCFAQAGAVYTVAGGGTSTADGVPATSAAISTSCGVGADAAGNVYFIDMGQYKIKKVNSVTGLISTVAGTGTSGYTGDGGPATAANISPNRGLYVDPTGNIFIAENSRIRKVDASTGIIRTVAGGGTLTTDGIPATSANISGQLSVFVDGAGNIYCSDARGLARVSAATGIITTIAGGGTSTADGIPATMANIGGSLKSITVDAAGNIYILPNSGAPIRKISAVTGIINTITGAGTSSADGIAATAASLIDAHCCRVDAAGNLFIADWISSVVRRIDATTGLIYTIAGGGASSSEGAPASAAIVRPYQICLEPVSGTIYYSDFGGNKVRRFSYLPIYGSGAATSGDSMNISVSKLCNGPELTVITPHYIAGRSVKTDFGDGFTDSSTIGVGFISGGYAIIKHSYAAAGTYTIRQTLYLGATVVDTISYSYTYTFCRTLPIKFFYDGNANCLKDGAEPFGILPSVARVDSNGVPVDTVSATSGFSYNAYSTPGAIYRFSVLSSPGNLTATCPSVGYITDTISSAISTYPTKYFGMACTGTSTFDLAENAVVPVTGMNDQWGHIYVRNNSCNPTTSTVTLHFSPKYVYTGGARPSPSSASANTITWNLSTMMADGTLPTDIYYVLWHNPITGFLTAGDTVHEDVTVAPIIGDGDTSNNNEIKIDTVRASCDPNDISVSPAGCIASGVSPVELTYTVRFENTGTDTADNIYIMDTLSDHLDPQTLRIVMATHSMDIDIRTGSGHGIVKFDFPNIKLLDSSHHGECTGAVIYTIKTRPGLSTGTHIYNYAGIYFDYNDAVMTNTADNVIGCPTTGVDPLMPMVNNVEIYPNPATNQLTIKTEQDAYTSFTITNSMGQVLAQQSITAAQTNVDIKALAPGLYYVTMKGESGVKTMKFVKM